jgi:hypothetical protein
VAPVGEGAGEGGSAGDPDGGGEGAGEGRAAGTEGTAEPAPRGRFLRRPREARLHRGIRWASRVARIGRHTRLPVARTRLRVGRTRLPVDPRTGLPVVGLTCLWAVAIFMAALCQ